MNTTTEKVFKFCGTENSPTFIILVFPSNQYILNQMLVCVVNFVLVIPAILLNGIYVITVLRSHLLRGKICYFLIGIQSVADLLVAGLTIPSFTYLIYSEINGNSSCTTLFVLTTIGLIPGGLSLASLCAITFERYMGVIRPIFHLNYLTKKVFIIYMIVSTVILSIGVPYASRFVLVYYTGMVIVIGISLLVNAAAYIKIFVAVGQRIQPDNSIHERERLEKKSGRTRLNKRKNILLESKLARSCAFVVILFYICYFPGLVASLYFVDTNKLIYRVVHSWYVTNFALNCSLNSIVFFWKRPILRKETIRVFQKLKRDVFFPKGNVVSTVKID